MPHRRSTKAHGKISILLVEKCELAVHDSLELAWARTFILRVLLRVATHPHLGRPEVIERF